MAVAFRILNYVRSWINALHVPRLLLEMHVHISYILFCKNQPLLNMRMHAGDLMLASSILISGNNLQKMSTLATFLKLPLLSSSTFHRIQRTYIVPSIDRFWMQQQEDVLSEFQDKDLIVLGKAT